MEVSLYKISLTSEEMDKIQNKIDQRMKNLYYKSMWKPKIGCYKFCVYGGKFMYNSNKN